MKSIESVISITKHSASLSRYGALADNIRILHKLDLPAPSTLLFPPTAFEQFTASDNLLNRLIAVIRNVPPDNPTLVADASQKIQKLIKATKYPDSLSQSLLEIHRKSIGRSYYTLAKADSLNSFTPFSRELHRGGSVLLDLLRSIWAASFTPKAIVKWHYSGELHLPTVMATALANPDVTGTVYTTDISTQHKGHLLVKAIWGIESDTSILSDHYTVDKLKKALVKKQLTRQSDIWNYDRHGRLKKSQLSLTQERSPKLTDDDLAEIATHALKLHHTLQKPLELKFFKHGRSLYFTHFKPIEPVIRPVTPSPATPASPTNLTKIATGLPASPGLVSGPVKLLKDPKKTSTVSHGEIIIVEALTSSLLPVIKYAAGIITLYGGVTSHAAIIAREIGIPAIVSAPDIMGKVKSDDIITLNGQTGEIYRGGLPAVRQLHPVSRALPSPTHIEKTATKVKLTLSSAVTLSRFSDRHDGVGLLKGDILLTEFGYHPDAILTHPKLKKDYLKFLTTSFTNLAGELTRLPLTYEPVTHYLPDMKYLKGIPKAAFHELNAGLSLHSSLHLAHDSKFFELQLKAIESVSDKTKTPFYLILPSVRSVMELNLIKRLLAGLGFHKSIIRKLYLGISTPGMLLSAAQIPTQYLKGVYLDCDRINMYLSGYDLDNPEVNGYLQVVNPALLHCLHEGIKGYRDKGFEVYLYGRAVDDGSLLNDFVSWGITGISVSPSLVTHFRELVYQSELKNISSRHV